MKKKTFTMPEVAAAKIEQLTRKPEEAFLTPQPAPAEHVSTMAEFKAAAVEYVDPRYLKDVKAAEEGAEQAYQYYLEMKEKHPEGKEEDLIKNALGLSHLFGINKAELEHKRKATGSINRAIQAAADQRKRKTARAALLLDNQLYEDSRAYARRHNLSFNALVATLLKLALEKEERN